MPRLNLERLHTFALVIATGSFTAAAGRLGLSQPAVSLQVRQLEHDVRIRLVERVGKTMMPTPAGRALLDHHATISAAVADALHDVAQYSRGIAGNVSLGCGATACIHLLPPMLRRLKQDFPELTIGVRTGNTGEMINAVEENRLDLALVTLPAAGRNLQITPLVEDEFVAIFAHADARLPYEITPQRLARLPLVLFESGSHTRALIDRWLLSAGGNVKPVMELGSIEAIKEMVAAGLGASIIPRMALDGDTAAAAQGIAMRSLSPVLHRTLGLVMRQDKPVNQGLGKVLHRLRLLARG